MRQAHGIESAAEVLDVEYWLQLSPPGNREFSATRLLRFSCTRFFKRSNTEKADDAVGIFVARLAMLASHNEN